MPGIVELLTRLREVGCELERQPSGRWRIRYGKAVASGRVTEAEMRDKWLRPNADKLRAALAMLEEPEEKEADNHPASAKAGVKASTESSSPDGFDPRPDLADDHDTWEVILREAQARNRIVGHYQDADGTTRPLRLEELFHALRCFGVTVTTQQGPHGTRLKLIWEHVCAPEQDEQGRWVTWMRPEQFRRMYLEPYRGSIAEHLRHVMGVMHDGQQARTAA